MRTLLLIPARAGSKGLPGKNLHLLGGIPLVGRAVRLARQAARVIRLPHRVVCSTEDPAIAAAAEEWGGEVPFVRPAGLASDQATTLAVVMQCLEALAPDKFDCLVLIQATSPLTAVADVTGAIALHERTGAPVISVCRDEHPAAWQFHMDEVGRLTRSSSASSPSRRQDAVATYRPNGAVYVATPEQLRLHGGFVCPATRGFEMPPDRSVDIDIGADLHVAESLLRLRPAPSLFIPSREIGPRRSCFIIAEAGVNHNGSLELARQLVDAARAAGADAVKFQTFRSERVVAASAPKAEYQARQTGALESQLEMVQALELSFADFRELKRHCETRDILFLSTPFEEESADFLCELGLPLLKVPSGEITNLPFLAHLARKGLPLVVSTGMSRLSEVATAVDCIRAEGDPHLALLQCVSRYPTDPQEVNLRAMRTMADAFNVPVGYSDHTLGIEVAVGAVALGACVIEKHLTLDRGLPGPDHQASLDPQQFAELVRGIRAVEAALGSGRKEPVPGEANTAAVARRSLVAARTLPQGTVLTRELVGIKRPGTGLSPAVLERVIGRRLRREVAADELLSWDVLE